MTVINTKKGRPRTTPLSLFSILRKSLRPHLHLPLKGLNAPRVFFEDGVFDAVKLFVYRVKPAFHIAAEFRDVLIDLLEPARRPISRNLKPSERQSAISRYSWEVAQTPKILMRYSVMQMGLL